VKPLGGRRAATAGLTAGRRRDALVRVGDDRSGLARHRPRRSRALRGEALREKRQCIGVRQMARERELDRALQLLDPHRDLDEDAADGRDGRAAPARPLGRREAQRMQEPYAPMCRNRRNWLACQREHAVLSERVLSFMSLIRFSMHPRAQ
jgi:hypothetical protein